MIISVPSALVVDASVATKWYLAGESHLVEATAILSDFLSGPLELWAPFHFRAEVPAALTSESKQSRPRISVSDARQAIATFVRLPIRTDNRDILVTDGFDLSQLLRITLYDAIYLALARDLGIPFVTADLPLYQRAQAHSDIIWIGDYPIASMS